MKKLLCLMLLICIIPLYACGKETTEMSTSTNPTVTIEVKGYSEPMVLELYYDIAPNTVRNFIYLAKKGYYTNSTFHRVIKDFMIQGGSGDNSACTISGEFASNNFENDLKHVKGVISMARTSVKNSATSQFFIMHKASTHLDGDYAAFGMLISGFETLDAIAAVNTNYNDQPLKNVVIDKITVDTKGVTYDAPTCYGKK